MQTRHFFTATNVGLRLALRLAIWQPLILWGSILFSSPVGSTPKPTVRPNPDDTRPIATHVSILATSPSLQPRVRLSDLPPSALPRSDRPSAPRYGAAALLPLQPVQGEHPDKMAQTASLSFSEPRVVMAIEGTIAQSNRPTSSQSDGNVWSQSDGNVWAQSDGNVWAQSDGNVWSQSDGNLWSQSDGKPPTSVISDPELGILRLQAPEAPPAATSATDLLGQMQPRSRCASGAELDPELGCLPLQPLPPPPPPRQPVVYLLGRVDYFRSSNVFSAVDPVDDGLIRPGLTLFSAPALGRNTYFIGSIDGNLIRYNTQAQIDYNELRFRAGIFQRLSPTMFGELGWSNQQLFIAGGKIPGLPVGTRFLNDHAIRFELSRRDQLNKRLSLNTFYQFRLSFADPGNRSRLLNSLIASLSYDVQPNLQVGFDYQFALANFTAVKRDDQYHQVAARLTYTAFRNTQLNVFVGYSFGSSTDPTIEFNSLIVGLSLTVSLGLF